MRKVTNGKGVDVTSQVASYLLGNNQLSLATLYLIGERDDPNARWLTDWDSALQWSWWGTFLPAVIKRGSVTSKIGLEVQTLEVEWSPERTDLQSNTLYTSFYQQALIGNFDGATFRAWTVYMPTPGDADTYGASELFGGRVGPMTIARASIKFTVNSFLDVVNQYVPGAVIEGTNSISGYSGAVPPSGSTSVPTFSVVGTASTNLITGHNSTLFGLNAFQEGFLFMLTGALAGQWSAVFSNSASGAGGNLSFTLGQPFPFPPAVGDTFFVSANLGTIITGSGLYPFPYVPAPEQSV